MIGHDELCSLIPHSHDMCLLDSVEFWDEDKIICYSNSHRLQKNPLRRDDNLSSVHVLEYAAQAMAVHGGLHNRENGKQMTEGYLAALRDVKLNLCELNLLKGELLIEANKILSQDGNMIYTFTVSSEKVPLASGRATVISISHNQ